MLAAEAASALAAPPALAKPAPARVAAIASPSPEATSPEAASPSPEAASPSPEAASPSPVATPAVPSGPSYRFVPPKSFAAVPSHAGSGMSAWVGPFVRGEKMVEIVAASESSPATLRTARDYDAYAREVLESQGTIRLSRGKIGTTCHGTLRAYRFVVTDPGPKTQKTHTIEGRFVFVSTHGRVFLASYARDTVVRPNALAIASLDTLCPAVANETPAPAAAPDGR